MPDPIPNLEEIQALDRAHVIHPISEFSKHEKRGAQIVVGGHGVELQLAHPDWKDVADVDGETAHKTRIEFLERYADTPVLILGTHFASPTGGHVVRDGDVYRFQV